MILVVLTVAGACGTAEQVTSSAQAPEPTATTTTGAPAVDPRRGGVVVDLYGRAVAGATVTLWEGSSVQGPFTPVPEGAAVLHPSNRRNPVVTGADGTFDWTMLPGIYKLTAVKAGCFSKDGDPSGASASFVVPPALDGLRLELDCRPRDTTPPKIRIDARPPEKGNGPTVRLLFTVTDDQPDYAIYCLLDDEEVAPTNEGIFGRPCTSPYVRSGLEEGFHKITILAVDDQANFAVETVRFSVD